MWRAARDWLVWVIRHPVCSGLFICIGIYLFFQKEDLNDYIPTFNESYFIKQIDIM